MSNIGTNLTGPVRQKANRPDDLQKLEVRSIIKIRKDSARFLRKALGYSLAVSFAIFLFQGFGFWGFHLNEAFLNWLGIATVGQVAGLFAMVLRLR